MYHRILLPVSFDHERDGQAAIAVAQKLKAPDGEITLLHIIEQIPNFAVGYIPESVMVEGREQVARDLEAMAETVDGAVKTVVQVGHAGRAILDFADEQGVDCIVMPSHRPEIEDYLLGSTAARVVRHAPCSVHVIR